MYIGVDIVDIIRVKKLIKNERFLASTFTQKELKIVEEYSEIRKAETLAGRFAVKEAVAKALGTGFTSGIALTDIETLKGEKSEPILKLYNITLQTANELGVKKYNVSISHSDKHAIGMVVLT